MLGLNPPRNPGTGEYLRPVPPGTPTVPDLNLRTAPDPLLAALVDLLLPERHALLERVDRVLARCERVGAVRRGDGDHDARLADADPADAVVDGDRAELVAGLELGGDLGHDPFGHALVGLVVQVHDVPAARLAARRADEGRDRAGARVSHLVDGRVE